MKYKYDLGKLSVTLDTEMSFADGDTKRWVSVEFPDGTMWVPAFRDLFYLNQLIAWCEDMKYANGRGRGRFYMRDFLKDTVGQLRPGETLEEGWQELVDKYDIPQRTGDSAA